MKKKRVYLDRKTERTEEHKKNEKMKRRQRRNKLIFNVRQIMLRKFFNWL